MKLPNLPKKPQLPKINVNVSKKFADTYASASRRSAAENSVVSDYNSKHRKRNAKHHL